MQPQAHGAGPHQQDGGIACIHHQLPEVSSSASIGVVPTTWTIVGTGDFNGDGKGDILWRDSSGNTAIWFMNGASVSSSAGLGNVPLTWTIVGTADFDGDGKADIL